MQQKQFTSFWSISHDCAKFSHDHAKSALKFSLSCSTNLPSGPFRIVMQNFRMIMRNGNIWFLSFLLSFLPFPSSFSTSTASKSAQIPVQTNCITAFIMHLDHHQHYLFSSIWFISFVTNLSKSYLEITPKLYKTC